MDRTKRATKNIVVAWQAGHGVPGKKGQCPRGEVPPKENRGRGPPRTKDSTTFWGGGWGGTTGARFRKKGKGK